MTMMALILKTRGVCADPPEGLSVVQPLGTAAGSACISPAYYEVPLTGETAASGTRTQCLQHADSAKTAANSASGART